MEHEKHKKDKETKDIQQMEYRMYENKYPNVDDLVMVSYQLTN
jgi:hypothetical protein